MTNCRKVRFRSEVERKRNVLDNLEEGVQKGIKNLEILKHGNPELVGAYLDYLKWCIDIFEARKSRSSNKDERSANVKDKLKFHEKCIHDFSMMSCTGVYYDNPFQAKLIRQPVFRYGSFLQNALQAYFKYIDIFQMWIAPEEAFSLLNNKESNVASFAFIAMLVRFILPRKGTLYLELYPQNLKKARKTLPQAYAKPSYQGIIGLIFLCFIAISHYNTDACVRYFGSAVRMAQALGYDKKEEDMEQLITDEAELSLKKKGKKVWKSISLLYFFLLTFIPNLPPYRVSFDVVTLEMPISSPARLQGNTNSFIGFSPSSNSIIDSNKSRNLCEEKKLIECLIDILAHVQKVRDSFANSIESIPNEALRLPSDKFNQLLTKLISQGLHEVSIKNYEMDDFTVNISLSPSVQIPVPKSELFKYKCKLDIFHQLSLIFLYYPSVLVFPKPLKFSCDEANILLRAAQVISEFYFKVHYHRTNQDEGNLRSTLAYANSSSTVENEFQLNSQSLFYNQTVYVVYIYFTFISEINWFIQQGFDKTILESSKSRAMKILNILKEASTSKVKSQKKDALKSICNIGSCLKNFNLPEPYLISVNMALNLD